MVDQNSSLSELMAHAGFSRRGSGWFRTVDGVEYAAQNGRRKPLRSTVDDSGVYVVRTDTGAWHSYDTVLHMSLVWGRRQ